MNKRIISHRATKIIPVGLQGFLWYLSETVDNPLQTFGLAPGARLQHVTHRQHNVDPDKKYEITIGSDEDFVTANLIIKKESNCEFMMLMEEHVEVKSND